MIEYKYQVREENTNEIVIWLEDENKSTIGIITHKKGTKRIRQDKKEK